MLTGLLDWFAQQEPWVSAVVGFGAIAAFLFAIIMLPFRRKPPVRGHIPGPDEAIYTRQPKPPREVLDVESFLRTQQKLRDELKAELEDAHAEDRARLQARIDVLTSRIAEPEKSLVEAQKRITDLESILEREGNEIGAERLAQARDALKTGDYSIADELFAEIEARQELAVQQAARAAYGRGEVAEAEVRWQDAADHFGRAAELEPSFDHLLKAREYLWRAGRVAEALGVGQKLMAPDVSDTPERRAEALNEHAISLQTAGRFDEAEQLYREALELIRETIGARHPDYATQLNNLAGLLQVTGRYDEAEPLVREALEIGRETIGARHPDYATRLNNLAELLRVTGRYDEAEPLYRDALEIDRETVGAAHPDYAIRLNNLALLLEATGRTDEAEPLYRATLEIDREALGERHPDYATDLNNLATLLRATGRSDEAEPLYREAIDIFEATLGPEHPNTKQVKQNLADLLDQEPSD